jgi:predicted ester cyclase
MEVTSLWLYLTCTIAGRPCASAHRGGERRDLNGTIASFHHPRYDVVPMGASATGAAVRELIGGLVRAFPDFHFEPLVMHHADRAVVVEGRLTGTHRVVWAGILPRGGRMDLRVACVFDFEGERLMNETVYFDFATLQRQLSGG